MTRRFLLILGALVMAQASPLQAQFPEDALRLALPGPGVGARAVGMGGAYTGIASDYSAISWNPAGLAQMRLGEFSIGGSYMNMTNNATFFDGKTSTSASAGALNTLGLVYPAPTRRGSLVFAFGYHRQANFLGTVGFNGFNGASSIIQSWAPDGTPYPNDVSGNIAYQLYLADVDTLSGRWISPITRNVTQSGDVRERGGLDNYSMAGAVDVAKNVSLGVTLTYIYGNYRYERFYEEEDQGNFHQSYPYDYQRLTLDEYIESEISGFTARFGLMFRSDLVRLGLTAKTPSWMEVKELFGSTSRSYFDNGDIRPVDAPFSTEGSGQYDVHTPWVFGAGASLMVGELVLAGDIQFTDWTTLEFADANSDVIAWNREMSTIFRATLDWSAGFEQTVPGILLRIRGGFKYMTSPYRDDALQFDLKRASGGIGIPLGPSAMLDATYARTWGNSFRYNYDTSSRVDEELQNDTVLLTLSVRFE
jgi:long-subunit fatty acid transport protein